MQSSVNSLMYMTLDARLAPAQGRHLQNKVESSPELPATQKEAIVLARGGEGLFLQRVQQIETSCRSAEELRHLQQVLTQSIY